MRIDEKLGGPAFLAANDLFVKSAVVTRDVPAASHVNAVSAENEAVQAVFILTQDLDVNNNYTHIRMKVADVGANAQLGCIIYIPSGRNYQGKQNVSALA